jgi:hypothetical protein
VLQISAAAGASGLSSLRLLAPVIWSNKLSIPVFSTCQVSTLGEMLGHTLSDAGGGVAAGGAGVLLDVERAASCCPVISPHAHVFL